MKHTKEEWTVEEIENKYAKGQLIYNVRSFSGGLIVSSVSDGFTSEQRKKFDYETEKQNAKLIAAAPDLLEAALQIKNEIDTEGLLQHSYDKLLAAIEKATK